VSRPGGTDRGWSRRRSGPLTASFQPSQVEGPGLATGRHRRFFRYVDRSGIFHLLSDTVAMNLPAVVFSTPGDANGKIGLVVHEITTRFPRPKHQRVRGLSHADRGGRLGRSSLAPRRLTPNPGRKLCGGSSRWLPGRFRSPRAHAPRDRS
jgi:hypothetical protein